MVWVWAGLFISTLIVEVYTAEMVSIWFTVGSLVSFFLALCTEVNATVQILVFLGTAVVLMICTRRIFLKMLKTSTEKTNLESLIDSTHKLTKEITEDGYGEVKINGVVWRVVSKNKKPIDENKKVKIIKIDGNKFIVEEIKEDE